MPQLEFGALFSFEEEDGAVELKGVWAFDLPSAVVDVSVYKTDGVVACAAGEGTATVSKLSSEPVEGGAEGAEDSEGEKEGENAVMVEAISVLKEQLDMTASVMEAAAMSDTVVPLPRLAPVQEKVLELTSVRKMAVSSGRGLCSVFDASGRVVLLDLEDNPEEGEDEDEGEGEEEEGEEENEDEN